MTSKLGQVADVLEHEAGLTTPGTRLRSVQLLMDELGVGIGTVIAGVDEAVRRGVPIERRRGPDGGYFRANGPQPIGSHRSSRTQDSLASAESALVQARRLRDEMEALIATLETATSQACSQ